MNAENKNAEKKFTVFLASSINEFAGLRDHLESVIHGLNHDDEADRAKFQVRRCEYEDRAFSKERKQDELNQLVRECDFFFLIAGRHIGDATKEEFETAYRQFRNSGPAKRPRIRILFQKLPDDRTTAELKVFRDYVRTELEQYPDKFSGQDQFSKETEIDNLIYQEFAFTLGFSKAERFMADKRKLDEIENRMQINRHRAVEIKNAAALSESDMTKERAVKIAELYAENMTLAEENRMKWDVLYDYADFLYKQKDYHRAIKIGVELDKRYTAADEPDDRAGIKLLIGKCHIAREEYDDAESYLRDALKLYRTETDDPEADLDAAEAASYLADALEKTYRPRAAEACYRDALSVYLKYLPDDPESYADEIQRICYGLRCVLIVYPDRAEESEILRCGEQACVNFAAWDGEEVSARLDAEAENLRGWLEQYPCPPDLAQQIFRDAEARAEELTKGNPGGYKLILAAICNDTANFLREHNRMEDANTLGNKALTIARNLAADDNASQNWLAACCNTVAMVAEDTNRPKTAERLYLEDLEISRKLSQEDPAQFEPYVARIYENLSVFYKNIKRYREAERLCLEALAIRRRLAREDPAQFEPYVAHTCMNLANLYGETNRYGEAERLYLEALEIYRGRAKENPARFEPDMARTCMNLAFLYEKTKRYGEAERLYLEALTIFRKLSQEDPAQFEPYVAHTCYNLGAFELVSLGDRAAARPYLEEAMAIFKKYPHLQKDWQKAHRLWVQCL